MLHHFFALKVISFLLSLLFPITVCSNLNPLSFAYCMHILILKSPDGDFLSDSDIDKEEIPSPLVPHSSVLLPTCLHWVRMSSLRCRDNPALTTAMINKKMHFRAVFTYDPWFESGQKFGLNR